MFQFFVQLGYDTRSCCGNMKCRFLVRKYVKIVPVLLFIKLFPGGLFGRIYALFIGRRPRNDFLTCSVSRFASAEYFRKDLS